MSLSWRRFCHVRKKLRRNVRACAPKFHDYNEGSGTWMAQAVLCCFTSMLSLTQVTDASCFNQNDASYQITHVLR